MSRPLLAVVIISVHHQGAFAHLGVATRADQLFSWRCTNTLGLLLGSDYSILKRNVSYYYDVGGVQGLCAHVSPAHSRQVWGRPFRGPSCSQTSVGSTKSFVM